MSQTASGQGGRYNRSFEGLIGAMIVMVLVVVGFVLYRGLFSDPPELSVDAVDYRAEVADLQANGLDVVYPATLPDGWKATRVPFEPGEKPRFGINFFTDDDDFVGLRQVEEDVDDLLEESGVEDADEADPLTGVGGVASTWEGWSDPNDGDHAFTAEVGGRTVLVYGDVPADELAELVGLLTEAPVPATTPSAPAS